jgi:hypothetical protein
MLEDCRKTVQIIAYICAGTDRYLWHLGRDFFDQVFLTVESIVALELCPS